jgi:hypothetical protein
MKYDGIKHQEFMLLILEVVLLEVCLVELGTLKQHQPSLDEEVILKIS